LDRDKIWQECPSSKYAPTESVVMSYFQGGGPDIILQKSLRLRRFKWD